VCGLKVNLARIQHVNTSMRIPQARISSCVESAFQVLLEACRGNRAACTTSRKTSSIAGGGSREHEMEGRRIDDGVIDR
jgi:hypothetical protein